MASWYPVALNKLRDELSLASFVEGFDFLQDFYLDCGNDYDLYFDFESAEEFAESNFYKFQGYVESNGIYIGDTGRWSIVEEKNSTLNDDAVSRIGLDISEYSDLLKLPLYELNDDYYHKIENLVSKLRSLNDKRIVMASMKLAEAATMSGKSDERVKQIWLDSANFSEEYSDDRSLVKCLLKLAYLNIKLSLNLDSARNYRRAASIEVDTNKKVELLRMARIQYQAVGDHQAASEVFLEKMKLKSGGGFFKNKTLKILRFTSDFGESPRKVFCNIAAWIAIFTMLTYAVDLEGICSEKDWLYGLVDRIYYVMVSFTTLGYGDITPVSPGGRILAGVMSAFGLVYTSLLMVTIVRKYSRS